MSSRTHDRQIPENSSSIYPISINFIILYTIKRYRDTTSNFDGVEAAEIFNHMI